MIDIRAELKPFLETHPNSELKETTSESGSQYEILRPWDDESIKIILPDDAARFISLLNDMKLNYRFSGVYYLSLQAFEIIWTPFPLDEDLIEIENRSFKFQFKGKEHNCRFGATSEGALLLAKYFEQTKFSETQNRNLGAFRFCMDTPADEIPFEPNFKSFWVENITDFDEDTMIELVGNLNFYMTYYDWISPMTIVHPPFRPPESTKTYVRYPEGKFPEAINARPMDDNLLHFWLAAKAGDQSRRFIYYFRILEYCASVYVDYSTRLALKKILLLPNSMDNISVTEDRIISTIKQYTRKDRDRMEAMLMELVATEDLWPHVMQNKAFLTAPTEFDGGFSIKPLLNENCKTHEDWHNGIPNFNTLIHQIRNALSHGQDQRTSFPIIPTQGNFEKLRPWVSLAAAAAAKVMILRGSL